MRFLGVLSLVFSVLACQSQSAKLDKKAGDKLYVTSFYAMQVLTQNIAGDIDGVTVANLTKQTDGDLHGYQLKPSDMMLLEKADAFIINSYEHEFFAKKVHEMYPELPIIEAGENLQAIGAMGRHEDHDHEAEGHDHEAEEHEGHDHRVNAHFWLNPSMAAEQVKTIANHLSKIDANHAEIYQNNAENYGQVLTQLHQRMQQAMQPYQHRGVVTFHDAFPFLFDSLSLDLVGVLQLEPGINPSPRELEQLTNMLSQVKGVAVFSEPQYDDKLMKQIAESTGKTVFVLNPVTNGADKKEAYVEIMEKNLETLLLALKE
jgi:zinc transport system substrate-binding protein